jgi:hypothetical protein
MNKLKLISTAVAASIGLFSGMASAVTVTYNPVLINQAQDTSATDLANSDQSSFGSWTIEQGSIASGGNTPSGTTAVLSDGGFGFFNGNANNYNFSGGFRPLTNSNVNLTTVILLTLTGGYDLTGITTVSGSADAGFYATRQNYKLEVAQVGSAVFTTLVSSLDQNEANNAAAEERYRTVSVATSFTGADALNIDRIRFTFLAGPGDNGKLYREIDVFGSAAAAIPEPSTYAALLGLAGFALAASRRRRVQ